MAGDAHPPASQGLRGPLNHGAAITHQGAGGGGKIPYPTHVWSPAGGWYTQPRNWKANTAVVGAAIFGIVAMAWSVSADREHRTKFPEAGRFYPSRYWSREIIEHERNKKQ